MADAPAMTVGAAAEHLGLGIVAGSGSADRPVAGGIVGDLLSYIMAHGKPGDLWITIQTHPNVVAVAALGGLAGIVFAGGFEPEEETVARAGEEGVPLLTSPEPGFVLAGRLYGLGVR